MDSLSSLKQKLHARFVHREEIIPGQDGSNDHWQDGDKDGWRVSGYDKDGHEAHVSMRFASRRDAELAIYSLSRHGITSLVQCDEMESAVLYRMMTESLMW